MMTTKKQGSAVRIGIALPIVAEYLEDMLNKAAGKPVAWILVCHTNNDDGTEGGVAQHISNCERKDGIELIEHLLARWRAGRADIPAHYNPDL